MVQGYQSNALPPPILQKNIFPCPADHEQDWQPYLVDSYSAIGGDNNNKPIVGVGNERRVNWSMVIRQHSLLGIP